MTARQRRFANNAVRKWTFILNLQSRYAKSLEKSIIRFLLVYKVSDVS